MVEGVRRGVIGWWREKKGYGGIAKREAGTRVEWKMERRRKIRVKWKFTNDEKLAIRYSCPLLSLSLFLLTLPIKEN